MSLSSSSTELGRPAGVAKPSRPAAIKKAHPLAGVFRVQKNQLFTVASSLAVLIVFLAAWQWLPGFFGTPEFILPKFTTVVQEALHMWQNGGFMEHFWITALEVIVGFLLGALLGVFVGVVLGLSPTAESVLSPYILALQIAPKVAFAPLFVMWLGYTVYPKILVAILIVFFPIMINVLSAIRTVDPDLVNLVRTLNATRWQIFRLVEFPSSLPALFSGLRIGATLAVVGVTVGELVGGNMGLGFLLVDAEGQGNTAGVFVAIVGLTVIGIAAYAAVVWLERRCLHYIPRATVTTI